jgi:hypothetical protein
MSRGSRDAHRWRIFLLMGTISFDSSRNLALIQHLLDLSSPTTGHDRNYNLHVPVYGIGFHGNLTSKSFRVARQTNKIAKKLKTTRIAQIGWARGLVFGNPCRQRDLRRIYGARDVRLLWRPLLKRLFGLEGKANGPCVINGNSV